MQEIYRETAVKDKGQGSRSRLEEPGTCERREGRKDWVRRVSNYSAALRKSQQDQWGVPAKTAYWRSSPLAKMGGHKHEADQK